MKRSRFWTLMLWGARVRLFVALAIGFAAIAVGLMRGEPIATIAGIGFVVAAFGTLYVSRHLEPPADPPSPEKPA